MYHLAEYTDNADFVGYEECLQYDYQNSLVSMGETDVLTSCYCQHVHRDTNDLDVIDESPFDVELDEHIDIALHLGDELITNQLKNPI